MPKLHIPLGTTSKRIRIYVETLSGEPITGLVASTSGMSAAYAREDSASVHSFALVTAVLGTWSSGGVIEMNSSSMPGFYELGLPDGCFASGSGSPSVVISVNTPSNARHVPIEIQTDVVTSANVQNAASQALTNYDPPTNTELEARTVVTSAYATSANVSTVVDGVVQNRQLHYLVNVSVNASSLPANSLLSQLANTGSGFENYNRANHSLRALNNQQLNLSATQLTSAEVAAAVWNNSGTEPTVPITWASVNRGQIMDWLGARLTNRLHQSSTEMELYSSAGTVIASASTNLTSTSANMDQFI